MHIPDGYLSPTTCAALYLAAVPFWRVALRRIRTGLEMRAVPTLALVAAFTFVLMMFNLPLPGGTTGHAIGIGVAVVIVGPWGAIISISTALAIQALVFGDGGLLTLGANCVNIAIVAPLAAHLVYRLLGAGAPADDRRRVWAAALAGYAGLNIAALLAALELGIQPALFSNAAGVPLYNPYPIDIALPAIMLGHLAIAGVAEALITGGVVAWLQRSNPGLVDMNRHSPSRVLHRAGLRPLWIGLALLLVATPVGLLSAGTAWGEWSPDVFASEDGRREIAAASSNVAPPKRPPQGLERLASLWTAPIPDYAPAFLHDESLGYLLSAMFGTGTVMIAVLWLSAGIRKRSRGDYGIRGKDD